MKTSLALALMFAHCFSLHEANADTFGERQIAQVLDDRPAMRGVISNGHPVYEFVVSKFSTGGLQNRRVHWDNTEPISGAEHVCQLLCVVRVTSKAEYSGRDKWAMLVFELFNLSHADRVGMLRWQVVRDEINKDTFVNESLRLEIDAMRQAQDFLKRNPLPGLDPKSDGFYFRFLATPSSLDEYVKFLDNNKDRLGYDPRAYNASTYDSLRPQPIKSTDGG